MIAELFGLTRTTRRETRATLENPRVPLTAEAWEDYGWSAGQTDSGVAMSPEIALTYAPVWAAVNLISGAIAKLPINPYKRLPKIGDNAREKDTDHPANVVVSRKANREKTAFDFWRTAMVHCLIWNRAYAFIDQDAPGEPRELFNLLPDRTNAERLTRSKVMEAGGTPEMAAALDGQLVYVTEAGGRTRTFFPSQILHLKGISVDGIDGCELVVKARNAWALGLARRKFSSKFFKNGARVGGTLELPASMGKAARDKIEEGFRKVYEDGDNPFKVVVLRDAAKFHVGQVSPADAQLTESSQEDIREVCLWYKLQPSKLGLSDSVSYNSKSEDNQAFLDDTLSDWLSMIQAECWMKLLSPKQQEKDSHFFEHNTAALLRMNTLQRYQVYQIALASRVLNRNEVRAMENKLPVEGGDEFDPAPGSAQVSPENEPDSDEKPAEKPKKDEKTEKKYEDSAEFRRWIFDVTARARHKSHKPAAFLEWIDGGYRTMTPEEYRDYDANPMTVLILDLKKVAERATADSLTAAIEPVLKAFEQQWGA